MYQLTIEQSFDSAHFLAGYQGKCGNIHGHRWRVLLVIQEEKLKEEQQQRGMCVDFSTLKDELKEVADQYDHSFLIEKDTLKERKALAGLSWSFVRLQRILRNIFMICFRRKDMMLPEYRCMKHRIILRHIQNHEHI